MSRKSKSKISVLYDAPVTVTFALIVIFVFLVDGAIFKGNLSAKYLLAPTAANGANPFSFKIPLSYIQVLFHVVASVEQTALLSNVIIILLLGPILEEKYGSVIIGLMMVLSALLSGVLNASFCLVGSSGADSIVFMFVLLNSYLSVSKKKIPLSAVIVLILFISGEFFAKNPNGFIGILVNIAGGLCGSLLAFLTSPKARAAKKSEKNSKGTGSNFANDEKYTDFNLEALDESVTEKTKKEKKSIFSKKNSKTSKKNSDDDTTVIGTIEL